MKATLSLTHRCNLACTYCYAGKAFMKDMSFATAQKSIDFVLDIAPPSQHIEVCFFGGEPLLCFDVMQDVTQYIREKEHDTGRSINISVTTNATLLTQTVLDFFHKEHIHLCISIDGPSHVHNLNRCYKNGQGSFDTVVENLSKALKHLDEVQVNAVYGPDTVDFLPESVAFFTELGVPAMHLNPNICASWTPETSAKLAEIYLHIAHQYVQCYQRGQEIAVNLIDSKILLFLKGGYAAEDRCGMGTTEWGFAPSGNIYPCERFIGDDTDTSLCLGNINTGFDVTRRCAVLQHRGEQNDACKTCPLHTYCMNWCGCTNYYMTGHTDMAGPMLCASERAAMNAAQYVLVTLSDLENELFIDHFMRYVHEGRPA